MTTSPIDPSRLVIEYHAAINALDFETIAGFFADDATYDSGGIGDLTGRDVIMAAFRTYFEEYPDQVATDSLVEDVSPLAARSVWHLKASSNVTGKVVERNGEETITFNAEGKILRVDVTDL